MKYLNFQMLFATYASGDGLDVESSVYMSDIALAKWALAWGLLIYNKRDYVNFWVHFAMFVRNATTLAHAISF